MTNDVISAAEAWKIIEMLQIGVDYNPVSSKWCATKLKPKVELGWGATPLEAVGNLLARIGEAAQKAEAASAQ